MSIYEYDEERHMRQTKEEGYEEGFADGKKIGRESGLADGRESGLIDGRKMLKQAILLRRTGKTHEEIAVQCAIPVKEVKELFEGLE